MFTCLKEKLLDESKDQTFRVIFIPTYDDMNNEVVNIDFKDEDGKRETLYQAIITEIYPKRIKDVNLEEAKRDGFDSVEEFQEGIVKINFQKRKKKVDKDKYLNRWGFIIRFKKIKNVLDWLSK